MINLKSAYKNAGSIIPSYKFAGKLAEVRIWNYPLTAGDIQSHVGS